MATQEHDQKDPQTDANTTAFEKRTFALAEQLGRIAGTVEGTAEQWLNRASLTEQLTRIRDDATDLLNSLAGGAAKGRKAVTEGTEAMTEQMKAVATKAASAASAMGSSVAAAARKVGRPAAKRAAKKPSGRAAAAKARPDLAHAPGKKHRRPAPSAHGVKKSDQTIPKARQAETVRQRRKSYA